MKNIIIPFLILNLFIISLFSQTAKVNINVNNIQATVLNGGDLFDKNVCTPGFEVPGPGSPNYRGLTTIFSAGLWIGGLDAQKKLHLAACTYRQIEDDFEPGPVSDSAYTTKNSTYDKIYYIKKSDIDYHKNHYSNIPYSGNSAILYWPGNGNVSKGEAPMLAPFMDINKNNIYEPRLGDYPLIPGDACAFTIFNDTRHKDSLRIEVHQFVYEYMTSDSALDNTIFVSYKIFNRSNNNYDSLYVGHWTDYDIGNPFDDIYCSDASRNLTVGYNGDDDDDGINGYGMNPPAMGCLFLNHKLFNTISYNNDNTTHGYPQTKHDYYNYLKGFYPNDDPIQKFPCGSITGTPRDIRILGTTAPFTFAAKKEYCFTLAHIFARASSGGALGSLALLKQKSDTIQKFFDGKYGEDPCKTYPFQTGIANVSTGFANAGIYPNPATNEIIIELNNSDLELNYTITDAMGRNVLSGKLNNKTTTVDISSLATGFYFVQVGEIKKKIFKLVKN
jgi:hypothetical protein